MASSLPAKRPRLGTIADRGLRHLGDQGLGIAQRQMEHGTGLFEFVLQNLRFKPKALTCTLNDCATDSGFSSHYV